MKILLVEDDPMIGAGVRSALVRHGYGVDLALGCRPAEVALAGHGYVLILLDLGLPDGDGLQLLRDLRSRADATPVLVLTARDRLADRVAGLDLGADDYLVKPFEIDELLARVRALVRRRDGRGTPILGTGRVRLDLQMRDLLFDGQRIALAAREYALLYALLDRPGAVLSREQLETRLYGWGEEVSSNAVDSLIYSVRRKVEPELILNVRGLGWRIAPAALAEPA